MGTRTQTSPTARTVAKGTQTGDEAPSSAQPIGLLDLPLELVRLILDQTCVHPDVAAGNASLYSTDDRSHGWSSTSATLAQMQQHQATYADQMLALLSTCKTFYRLAKPRLYEAPVLLTASSIQHFASTISASRPERRDEPSSLVKILKLYPMHQVGSSSLTQMWTTCLPQLFRELTALHTFAPGVYAGLLPFEDIAFHLPPLRIENLDNLDFFAAFYALNPGTAQAGAMSLINAASARLKRLSFGTINLTEPGCGVRQRSRFINLAGARWTAAHPGTHNEETAEEYSPEDSCAPRFLQALRVAKVGLEWAEEQEDAGQLETCREKGLESIYFFGDSPIGMGVLHEMLVNVPNLRCLHLDSFTMLAPSLSTTIPFYSPQARRLHLPKLVESFSHMNCHLTELSFAPMLVSSTIKFGTMDSLLSSLPHLTHVDLRADFVTPEFFRPILASPTHRLVRLALHVLPPHAPPAFSTSLGAATHETLAAVPGLEAAITNLAPSVDDMDDGDPAATTTRLRKVVAVTIVPFEGKEEVDALAQAVKDLFFSSAEYLNVDQDRVNGPACDEKVVTWPRTAQEEFGDEDEQEEKFCEPVWYDLLMRLGHMSEVTGGSEQGDDRDLEKEKEQELSPETLKDTAADEGTGSEDEEEEADGDDEGDEEDDE